jgi:glycosyltransferase involved in cell wall biosynthesis
LNVSVVIPSYNRAHTLERALHSVFSQTLPVTEVIVVDDGSSDNTAELVTRKFPQTILIKQRNKGVSAARNTGIRVASSDWISLLDSDDKWLPNKLEAIRQAYQDNPQEILFHSDELWIRNGVRVNPMNKHKKSGGMIFNDCLPLCVISPSAAVIHRDIFDNIGFFNEGVPACEDYDLWLRICHLYPVHYIDEPLIIKYGGHPDQLSRKFWGMDRFRIQVLDELIRLGSLEPEQERQTRAMLLHKCQILLKGARKHANLDVIEQFQPIYDHYLQQTEAVAC